MRTGESDGETEHLAGIHLPAALKTGLAPCSPGDDQQIPDHQKPPVQPKKTGMHNPQATLPSHCPAVADRKIQAKRTGNPRRI